MKLALKAVLLTLSLGAVAAPKYSVTVFERPFTMPRNSFESVLHFTDDNMLALGADYGITDHTQIGLGWDGFDTAGNMPTQKISFNAAQFLFSTRHVSSMATFSMPFNFNRMVLQEVSLGMPTYIPLVRGKVNLVLLENLAKINWLAETYADFKIETRLSWQATHALCLNLITSPATLSTSGNHAHIIQATPLKFKALYAITPMVDVFGSIGLNNIQNASGLSGMLGVALRGGDIEG